MQARNGLTPALALDHVILLIVRRLYFPRDVVAFLSVLPSLDAPLAALLWLLTSSLPFKKRWPMPALEKLGPQHMSLAFAALPVIPSIQIRSLGAFQRALGGRYDNLGAFAAAWPHAIASITQDVDRSNLVVFRSLFQHCSQLGDVSIDADLFANVLPSLPSSVRHVSIYHDTAADEDTGVVWRLATPLQAWLSTGRKKKSVTIRCALALDDAAAVANVLATASSLSALDMQSSELVDALVASERSLPHLTRFTISHPSVNMAIQLLARLDLATLTRLDVQTMVDDLGELLPLLSTMPRLQELRLSYGRLCKTSLALANATPRLRELTLNGVLVASDDALEELLQWTCGLQQLRSVACDGMRFDGTDLSILQSALNHWINASGVTDVCLSDCKLGREGVNMVAAVLEASPRSSALERLDLRSNGIDLGSVRTLTSAAAHLVDTRIILGMLTETYDAITSVAELACGTHIVHQQGRGYILYSPQT
ncbi:hypothetical protein SPRG_07630, partial [Saprolegnia parasitica CBS 223.65]